MATRKIIIPIPTGTSDVDKHERSHLLASRWATRDKSVPRGELLANRVYTLDEAEAASFVRKGVAKYVGADGKPTEEQAPPAPKDTAPRPGTKEWQDLPAEDRVGSDEWRDIQLQKRLDEAALLEAGVVPEKPAPFVAENVALEVDPLTLEAPPTVFEAPATPSARGSK